MPIYEYRCKKCGDKYEVRVGLFGAHKPGKCPKCGNEEVERVYSPFMTDSPRGGSCSTSPGRFR